MSKRSISKLAEEWGVEPKDVVAAAEQLGMRGKRPASTVSDDDAARIQQSLRASRPAQVRLGTERVVAERMVTQRERGLDGLVTAREQTTETRLQANVIRRRTAREVVRREELPGAPDGGVEAGVPPALDFDDAIPPPLDVPPPLDAPASLDVPPYADTVPPAAEVVAESVTASAPLAMPAVEPPPAPAPVAKAPTLPARVRPGTVVVHGTAPAPPAARGSRKCVGRRSSGASIFARRSPLRGRPRGVHRPRAVPPPHRVRLPPTPRSARARRSSRRTTSPSCRNATSAAAASVR